MNPPCGGCGRAGDGPYTTDQCRVCWLCRHDPAFRVALRRLGKPRVALGRRPP